jgi:uncharacterized protein YbaR (Trm112 family)
VFIELVDLLRCPRDHEDTWLVAAIYEKADRDIIAGVLGCPICSATYPIRDGVAIFGEAASAPAEPQRDTYAESDEDLAMRCAAMLNLFDPGGAVILSGGWCRAARALLDITPVSILLVDPPAGMTIGHGVSAIRIGDRLPVAAASLRGIALDDTRTGQHVVESAVRALKSGGRLIAPVAVALPDGAIEKARDDRHWVGEVGPVATPPVPLTLRPRQG